MLNSVAQSGRETLANILGNTRSPLFYLLKQDEIPLHTWNTRTKNTGKNQLSELERAPEMIWPRDY